MCFCNPNIRTPFCNSKKCQDELQRINWKKVFQDFPKEPILFSAKFDPETTAKLQEFYTSNGTEMELILNKDDTLLQNAKLGETIKLELPNKIISTMVVQKKEDRLVLKIY